MKTGKRCFVIFLTVTALFAVTLLVCCSGAKVLPTAAATDSLAPTGQCGDSVFWSFDEATGALTISGTGAMSDYSAGGSPFYYRSDIKSVTINSGVTSIGFYTFYGCNSLSSVTIPNSVTSIGFYTFSGCSSLTSVKIGNGVTSIGDRAFSGCSSLTSVTIPNSVTRINGGTFYHCDSLMSVTIPNNVTSIGDYAFFHCRNLTSVTIPNSVTSIGNYAFYNCSTLSSVTIPDSVTSIGMYAFYMCSSLTSVELGKSVKKIGDGAFNRCGCLKSVAIPESVSTIGNSAFGNCSSLVRVDISDLSAWCQISFYDFDSNPLHYAHSLYLNGILVTNLVVPDNVTRLRSYAFYDCHSLMSVTISNNVTSIGNHAFDCCSNLSSVTIPNSLTSIGYYAFSNCSSLANVTIPNSVTSIGGNVFWGCNNLMTVTIGNGVTIITGSAFYGCKNLMTVTIGNGVTTVADNAFSKCTALTDVYYTGTEEQWSNISISNYNDPLIDATIHCNYVLREIEGTLTGKSTAGKIAVDNIWYLYDVSNKKLSDILANWVIGDPIYCRTEAGVIVSCAPVNIRNQLVSSVTILNGNDVEVTPENNLYDREELELGLDIASHVSYKGGGVAFSQSVAGFAVSFDKIVVSLPNTDLLYFKSGFLEMGKSASYTINPDEPIAVAAGQVCRYSKKPTTGLNGESYLTDKNLVLYVNASQEWGATEPEKQIVLNVEVFRNNTVVSSGETKITFKNMSAEARAEEERAVEQKARQSANIVNNTTGTLSHPFLSQLFTSDQLRCIETALQCKIALATLPESEYRKAGIEERIQDKLLSYVGVSRKLLGIVYDVDVHLGVNVDSSEYGRLKVDFQVPFSLASLNDGKPYAGWGFESNYKIKVIKKGKKSIPSGSLSDDITSVFTYANMETFADSVKSVAMAELESAYNLGYGNDFNKLCEMFFGNTVTKILSYTKFKTYKHLSWELMEFPSTHVGIQCPVDVFFYDENHKLCASVEDNEITKDCEDIEIYINGDEKHFYYCQGQYLLTLVAKAEGSMNVTVDEYANQDKLIRSVRLDDVILDPGDSFETEIGVDDLSADYSLNKNGESSIAPTSELLSIHAPQAMEIIDVAPSCTSEGKKHMVCSVCGEFIEELAIAALGHIDLNRDGKCDRCGKEGVVTHTPGDINGDGVLNNKDLNRLMKKLAGENVEYVAAALDVNGDGKVNNKDLNRLMKHLAGEQVDIF